MLISLSASERFRGGGQRAVKQGPRQPRGNFAIRRRLPSSARFSVRTSKKNSPSHPQNFILSSHVASQREARARSGQARVDDVLYVRIIQVASLAATLDRHSKRGQIAVSSPMSPLRKQAACCFLDGRWNLRQLQGAQIGVSRETPVPCSETVSFRNMSQPGTISSRFPALCLKSRHNFRLVSFVSGACALPPPSGPKEYLCCAYGSLSELPL